MVRNRLIWWQLVGLLILSVAMSVVAFFTVGSQAAALSFATGIGCLGLATFFAWLRYREIAELAASLDRVLHNQRSVSFAQCREGDVAILSNEIQKLVSRLIRTSEQLAEEKRTLVQAIEDISHQIRTPLTSISLMVPLVEKAENSQERRILLRELEALINRTSWLITTLLQMAKLDAGALELRQDAVSVCKLFEQASKPLLVAYDLKDVSLEYPQTASSQFRGDIRWSAEAVGNVLKNCLEHTPKGGTVFASSNETALATTLVVWDSGEGFTEEDLPHIFERFYRGKAAADSECFEGFGIGLAFARALTEAQGGSLTAANRPQGGAEFIFTFPKVVV